MVEKRGPWYLLTGLVLGGIAGLLFAWLVQPVRYTNTAPSSLSSEYKEKYRLLIAEAYMANNDLVRAQARLALLKDPDIYRSVAEQAQHSMAQGDSPQEARALGILAMALNQALSGAPQGVTPTTAAIPSSQAPASSQPISSTPQAGESAFSLSTPVSVNPTVPAMIGAGIPTATEGAPFALKSRQLVCDEDFGEPLIQVITHDAAGQPVPGIEIIINWEGGENHFFTGLKPELGLGYADFTMTEGVSYSIKLAMGGQSVADLVATHCDNSGNAKQWGVWRLEFVQP
jgi:hypothetical protein